MYETVFSLISIKYIHETFTSKNYAIISLEMLFEVKSLNIAKNAHRM